MRKLMRLRPWLKGNLRHSQHPAAGVDAFIDAHRLMSAPRQEITTVRLIGRFTTIGPGSLVVFCTIDKETSSVDCPKMRHH